MTQIIKSIIKWSIVVVSIGGGIAAKIEFIIYIATGNQYRWLGLVIFLIGLLIIIIWSAVEEIQNKK